MYCDLYAHYNDREPREEVNTIIVTSNPRAPLAGGSSVCSVGYLCSVGYYENSAVKMPFVTHLYAMTCTHRNRRTHYMTNTVIMTDAISNGAAKPYPLGRYEQT